MGTDRGVVLWDLARGTELAFLPIGMAWHSMFEPRETCSPMARPASCDGRSTSIRRAAKFRIGPPRSLALAGNGLRDRGRSNGPDRRGGRLRRGTTSHWATGRSRIGPLDDCRGVYGQPRWPVAGDRQPQQGGVTIWKLPDGARATKLPIDGGAGSLLQPRREMADDIA